MNKKEITGIIENLLKDFDEIIFAYIFGSFVEEDNFNDIDLAIYVNVEDSLAEEIFYEVKLSKVLEEKANVSVDIVKLNNASDSIIYKATKGLLVKDSNTNERINFITNHWKKYWDFNSKIKEYIIELKNGSR